MFQGSGNCTGNGNAYGNAVSPNGGETKTISNLPSASKIIIKTRAHYQTQGWLALNNIYNAKDLPTRFVWIRKGDNPASYSGFWTQPSLKNLLQNKGYLNAQGEVNITDCELLLATEMGVDPGDATADFQDAVLKLTFQ